jgi:hypothetical protein
MALDTAPTPIEAARAVSRGSRGIPSRIALDITDALAPGMEGIALTHEVDASITRIGLACIAGSRHAVMNEANRLGLRVQIARAELQRLNAEIEGPDVA